MRLSLRILLATLFISAGSAKAAVQFVPQVDADLLGGQSKYSGGDSTGFIMNLNATPALVFNEKLSLLPILSFSYRQNRDVQELVEGGGFLVQQNQDRGIALKGVYNIRENWKAKAHLAYKQMLVKETKDEGWGDGLFDHTRVSQGLEIEHFWGAQSSLRLGFDMYQARFPNFNSLASSFPEFGSEIQAGGKTLDFNAVELYAGGNFGSRRDTVSPLLLVSQRSFSDQHVVGESGSFSSDNRSDLYVELSLPYRRQLTNPSVFQDNMFDLRAGFDFTVAKLSSNQNSYDAAQFEFLPNFYDYMKWEIGPAVNVRFRDRWTAALSYLYGMRNYSDRPTQNADGLYGSSSIAARTQTLRWSFGYDIWGGLTAVLQGSVINSSSNSHFESLYRYNVSAQNIFAGISYQL